MSKENENPIKNWFKRWKIARQEFKKSCLMTRAMETYYISDYTDAQGVLHAVIRCKGEVTEIIDVSHLYEALQKVNDLRKEYVNKLLKQ